MKTVFEHIEHVRGKPHHVRERVAFGAAGGVTALIALVWLAASHGSGAFALAGSSFGEQAPVVTTSAANTVDNLAGAAAALQSSGADVPAHIEIVDAASSTSKKKFEQTTLPF